jgi:hypothetical protein
MHTNGFIQPLVRLACLMALLAGLLGIFSTTLVLADGGAGTDDIHGLLSSLHVTATGPTANAAGVALTTPITATFFTVSWSTDVIHRVGQLR